jgi:hypothetical protein
MFWGAMLIGFFVTDVLKSRAALVVAGLTVLLVIDYWPYQKPMRDSGVPASTIKNLEATYSALKVDTGWVKTYSMSGRYFHLLGPMYSSKPQVYEAFYNWMSPLGTGLLNQNALTSLEDHRAFLNLMAARYVVFDKTDPNNAGANMQQLLAAYRQMFPVAFENEDLAVFRNETAHSYVTGYARACAYEGDLRGSAGLAVMLAAHDWPLVHRDGVEDAGHYELTYREGSLASPPLRNGEPVLLTDVKLIRESSERISIWLTAPTACLAVIAESYYPFWRAEVDHRRVELLRVSCGLMGLELSPGTHEIELRYEPPRAYTVAGIVSVATLLGCITTLIWPGRRSLNPPA